MVGQGSGSPHASHTAALVFADGTFFFGYGVGKRGTTVGEICFNTSLTGYQEILTDPSYAGQVITFTFPHIGNVGANAEDFEADKVVARGLIVREAITTPSNFRSEMSLQDWLEQQGLVGISGVDTRAITRKIRVEGAQNVAICHVASADEIDVPALQMQAKEHPSMEGAEFAKQVTTSEVKTWNEKHWVLGSGYALETQPRYKVVAVDYGAKRNILRSLVQVGCEVIVVPADSSAEDVLSHKPDGIFLSNGPGDPAATQAYAVPVIKELLESGVPMFGICMGHQLLATALGCLTEKMHQGHRGANHPVQDLESGRVLITSQNHGFVVNKDELPEDVEVTHLSLFDQTVQGIRSTVYPCFAMQGHPEASPGPHDALYLFERFAALMDARSHSQQGEVDCA